MSAPDWVILRIYLAAILAISFHFRAHASLLGIYFSACRAAKGGMIALTRLLAARYGGFGARVNTRQLITMTPQMENQKS